MALRPASRRFARHTQQVGGGAQTRELDQHRQVDAGDDLDPALGEERQGEVGRCAPNMSVKSTTPARALHASEGPADFLACGLRVVLPADRDGGERGQLADDHLRGR